MPSASVRDIQSLPAILTVEQLQDFLGISRPKAYELVHTKGFPMSTTDITIMASSVGCSGGVQCPLASLVLSHGLASFLYIPKGG